MKARAEAVWSKLGGKRAYLERSWAEALTCWSGVRRMLPGRSAPARGGLLESQMEGTEGLAAWEPGPPPQRSAQAALLAHAHLVSHEAGGQRLLP